MSRLGSNVPTNTDIGTVANILGGRALAPTDVVDLQPLNASFDNTFEVGYKGLGMKGKLSFDFSAWAQQRGGGAITAAVATPWVFANPAQDGLVRGPTGGCCDGRLSQR